MVNLKKALAMIVLGPLVGGIGGQGLAVGSEATTAEYQSVFKSPRQKPPIWPPMTAL